MRDKILFFCAGFLLFIFLIGLVSAAACTGGESQRIMKLSSATNAHGSVWNNANGYTEEVCYDEFFPAYTGANPHACNGNNKLIKLFQDTNSHAQVVSMGGYAKDICYGDLDCKIVNTGSGGSCNAPEKVILSLYSLSNSHIAKGNVNGYNIKICCLNRARVCTQNSECNDGNPCTTDSCSIVGGATQGVCRHVNVPNAPNTCDDGNICTRSLSGTCTDGVCTGWTPKCAPPNVCNPATGNCDACASHCDPAWQCGDDGCGGNCPAGVVDPCGAGRRCDIVNHVCVINCGNGVCDAGENCGNCADDCLCGPGQTCAGAGAQANCVNVLGGCVGNDFDTRVECNAIVLGRDWCAWMMCKSPPCPPGTEGCVRCADISGGCTSYDHSNTCNDDPCGKANFDCTNLGCDNTPPNIPTCKWDAGQCRFKGEFPNPVIGGPALSCTYTEQILKTCEESGDETMVIKYTRDAASPASCLDKEIEAPCENFIKLKFFTWVNGLIAVIIIGIIYALWFFWKKGKGIKKKKK